MVPAACTRNASAWLSKRCTERAQQGQRNWSKRGIANSVHRQQAVETGENFNRIKIRRVAGLYDLTGKKHRIALSNPETAKRIVDSMALDRMSRVTVLDMYAGSLIFISCVSSVKIAVVGGNVIFVCYLQAKVSSQKLYLIIPKLSRLSLSSTYQVTPQTSR